MPELSQGRRGDLSSKERGWRSEEAGPAAGQEGDGLSESVSVTSLPWQ